MLAIVGRLAKIKRSPPKNALVEAFDASNRNRFPSQNIMGARDS